MSKKNNILHLKTTGNLFLKFKSPYFVVTSSSKVIHIVFNSVNKAVVNNGYL